MNNVIEELKIEAERLEWDALYSSKGSFNAAMLWNFIHYSLGILAVTLGALASKQIIDTDSQSGAIIAGIAAGLAAIITFLKPSDKAKPHHEAGIRFGDIKRKARVLQNISAELEKDPQSILNELSNLSDAYTKIQKDAPPIPWLAYHLTRQGVRKGENTYNEKDEKK